ncbi:MAG: M56 family metallopeptidase [Sphingobium sp.]|uniref:M56 family metallopeptidase n=1 Tax=Sphingobium sp. TaxID=1912891 RepID=UPI0029A47C01|nr:M56 family metallopeptidase [Sphingobium sp.]MDX3909644.1 M56 family metallopeptidase [Sphingobium sp.]
MSAPGFYTWIAEAVIASALLLALVMLLRRPVAQYLGARAAYALWALPLLRLLLPPLPQAATPAALLPVQGKVVSIGYVREAVQAPAAQFPWVEALLAVWIGGAVLFLLVQTFAYFRFKQLMLSDGVVIGHDGGIAILESVHARGPLAFGIVHRRVMVPVDFRDRYTPDEQVLALSHEVTHHRRGDLVANLLALLMLALHWCNPIAWIAYRAFRMDQELACDAQVLASHGQAQAYGRAILKAATAAAHPTGNRFNICHLNKVETLKGRLKMLSNHSASLRHITWGMGAVAVVTVAGLALTASGSGAAREMASVSGPLGNANLTRLTALLPRNPVEARAPQAPAAPAPPAPPAEPAAIAWAAPPSVPHGVPVVRIDSKSFHPDVRVPSQAELTAMVPDVRVDHGCTGRREATTQDFTDASGKRHVHVSLCTAAIQHEAMAEARAEMAEARRAVASARVMSAQDRAQAMADAQADLAEARAEMARAREEARREIDRSRAEIH